MDKEPMARLPARIISSQYVTLKWMLTEEGSIKIHDGKVYRIMAFSHVELYVHKQWTNLVLLRNQLREMIQIEYPSIWKKIIEERTNVCSTYD